MRKGARYWLAGLTGSGVLDAIFATTKIRIMGERTDAQLRAEKQNIIYALWHGRLLPLMYMYRHEDVWTLISRSADGEYLARVVQRWGYGTARGSSSRGGSEALRELVRAARKGHSLAITPDGPRGPFQKMKPGAITAAQLSGKPLLPISCAASRAWWFEGWDRFMVPKPFSTLYIRYGEPRYIPRQATESDIARIALEVEATLNQLTEQADADARG